MSNLSVQQKRLNREKKNAVTNDNPYIWYAPVPGKDLEWHFSVRGPPGSVYEGGIYHGKIMLPNDYPFSAPDFYFMTENGRFQINTKICLNISGYHNESWTSGTTIDRMCVAIQAFLELTGEDTKGPGAINASDSERRSLAKKSVDYVCPICGKTADLMLPIPDEE